MEELRGGLATQHLPKHTWTNCWLADKTLLLSGENKQNGMKSLSPPHVKSKLLVSASQIYEKYLVDGEQDTTKTAPISSPAPWDDSLLALRVKTKRPVFSGSTCTLVDVEQSLRRSVCPSYIFSAWIIRAFLTYFVRSVAPLGFGVGEKHRLLEEHTFDCFFFGEVKSFWIF